MKKYPILTFDVIVEENEYILKIYVRNKKMEKIYTKDI